MGSAVSTLAVRRRRKKPRISAARLILHALLVLYALISLVPFYFLAIRTFVPTRLATQFWATLPPQEEANLDASILAFAQNYGLSTRALRERYGVDDFVRTNWSLRRFAEEYQIDETEFREFLRPYVNYSGWLNIAMDRQYLRSLLATIFVVVVGVGGCALLSTATASVLAKFSRRYHRIVYSTYLLQTIIPPIMILLPLYLIITRGLGLQNSYFALILNNWKGGALPILLFTTFVRTIPKDINEAVIMEGGTHHTYFFRIVLPLSRPAMAAFIAIRTPRFWNELLYGFVFLNPRRYTLAPLIASKIGTFVTNFQLVYSALCFSLIPIIVLYLFFNKLFINAQLAGSIKG